MLAFVRLGATLAFFWWQCGTIHFVQWRRSALLDRANNVAFHAIAMFAFLFLDQFAVAINFVVVHAGL